MSKRDRTAGNTADMQPPDDIVSVGEKKVQTDVLAAWIIPGILGELSRLRHGESMQPSEQLHDICNRAAVYAADNPAVTDGDIITTLQPGDDVGLDIRTLTTPYLDTPAQTVAMLRPVYPFPLVMMAPSPIEYGVAYLTGSDGRHVFVAAFRRRVIPRPGRKAA